MAFQTCHKSPARLERSQDWQPLAEYVVMLSSVFKNWGWLDIKVDTAGLPFDIP